MRKKRHFIAILFLAGLVCAALRGSEAFADLPEDASQLAPALKAGILAIDPKAVIQENALVILSDGSRYVLVDPEQPVDSPDRIRIVATIPANQTRPDLIQLSDGHFLLKMVPLPGGRQTFPIIDTVPMALRSALFPQQMTFPEGFLMPTPWKSLTGNLLLPPEEVAHEPTRQYPLVMMSPTDQALWVWDVAKGQANGKIPMSCRPSNVVVSADAQQLYWGCLDQPKLFTYTLTGKELKSWDLPAPAGELALNADENMLYVTHPTIPKLSVWSTAQQQFQKPITLLQPANHIAISSFRHQVYVSSVLTPKTAPAPKPPQGFFKKLLAGPTVAVTGPDPLTLPNLQLIDTKRHMVEKTIPAIPDVSQLLVQDEKALWMASQSEKDLLAFDLRWQEFSPHIPVAEAPQAMMNQGNWLYLLLPQSNTLQRLNLKTLAMANRIPLEPNTHPQSMIVDARENQVYVTSQNHPGVQVINLNREQWMGTEKTDFQVNGPLAWLIPADAKPDNRIRIKFEDGRFLLQNVHGHLPAVLPSGSHGQPKIQTPPERSGLGSSP